ncbi:MAG TPA: flavin reductase family protein [Afifellaceae bacterium]|nr:flavin reductase family protein [Afifellaceae bacterium]
MNDMPSTGPFEGPSIDPGLFRSVMSRFATGVTVIATEAGGRVHAMTANAFMSGSLEPPLTVVSVAQRARMHGYLLAGEHFSVNVLSRQQEPVSRHFAGQPVQGLEIAFEWVQGVPLLPQSLARIAARTIASHACGDHTLFIGRILHMDSGAGDPLLFFNSRYSSLDHSRPEPLADAPYFW